MPTNEEVWAAMGADAALQIEVMASAYEQTKLTGPVFIERSARALLSASYAATRYADLAATSWAIVKGGLPTGVLGLLPPADEQDRLIKAVATLHAHIEAEVRASRSWQIRRLAQTNTMNRGRDAYQEALRERGVESWVRILSTDPCEGCLALKEEEGDAVPMDVRIWCHPGCKCSFVPSEEAERTWGERVRGSAFGLKRTWESGARYSSGLMITSTEKEKP